MSDRMRWRYGVTNPVVAAIDSDTVIEIGDLLWQDVDDAKPASMMSSDAGAIDFQGSGDKKRVVKAYPARVFADKFLGVAMHRSRNGDTMPIRVATTGVFEFDCRNNSTFELGDLIGVDDTILGDQLYNQQVAEVSNGRYAIGRVAKRAPEPMTEVLIDIRSTVMTGGVAGSNRN